VVTRIFSDDSYIPNGYGTTAAIRSQLMDLESNDAFRGLFVDHVESRDPIHPDAKMVSDRLNAVVIPFRGLIRFSSFVFAF